MQHYETLHQGERFAVSSVKNGWGMFRQLKLLVKSFDTKQRIRLLF